MSRRELLGVAATTVALVGVACVGMTDTLYLPDAYDLTSPSGKFALTVTTETGDLARASEPSRRQVSLSGRDLQILLGGSLALAAVASYCATRRRWRVPRERATRW